MQGCPDADGVTDNESTCTNSAGTAEAKGCPALDEATLKLIKENLHFEVGESYFMTNSKHLLDNVAEGHVEKPRPHIVDQRSC